MESHSRQGQAAMCKFCVAFKTEALKKGSLADSGEAANCCREGGGGCSGGGGGGGGICQSQRRRPRHARLLDEFQQLRRSMSDGELQTNPQEDEDSCADELEAATAASPANQNPDNSDCDSQQQQQQQQVQEARRHHHRRTTEQSQAPALHQRKKHKKADNYPCSDIEEDPSAELQQLQEQLPLHQHKSKQLQQFAVSFRGDEDEVNSAEESAVQLNLSLDDTCEFVAALDDLLELPTEEIDFPPPRGKDEDEDEDEDDETEDETGGEVLVAPAVLDGGAGGTVETDGEGAGVEKRAKWSRKSAKRSQQRQHLRRLQQTHTRSGENKIGDQEYHDDENAAEEFTAGGEEEAEAEHDDAASGDSIFNCQPDNAFDFFKLPEI